MFANVNFNLALGLSSFAQVQTTANFLAFTSVPFAMFHGIPIAHKGEWNKLYRFSILVGGSGYMLHKISQKN